MSTDTTQQQSRLKELIAKGKEQGFLTYAEVNDHLPDDISDPDQIEDIIGMINDMGITVYEVAPDADDLLTGGESTADELAAEEAAAALAAVETEAGRTTDPVRMYMREMGTVELLTREGEIAIAKRIEEGIRDVLTALVVLSRARSHYILETYAEVTKEGRLYDLLVGYLDPTDEVPEPAQVDLTHGKPSRKIGDEGEEEEEEEKGPDPIEAKRRFNILKRQSAKTMKTLAKGRTSAAAKKDLEKLGEAFSVFKLVPRHYDEIVEMPREALARVRRQERAIMIACVRRARMPRKVFLKEFQGNETSVAWVNKHTKAKKDYSAALEEQRDEIVRAQKKLKAITQETGLSASAKSRTSTDACRLAKRKRAAPRKTWSRRTCAW